MPREGAWRPQANLILTLRHQEVERVPAANSPPRGGLPSRLFRRARLCVESFGARRNCGRFAMIDNGLGFNLISWRPVLATKIGREVIGMTRGEDISWQFSRPGTLGIEIGAASRLALARDRVPWFVKGMASITSRHS
jgi:hypothetical protein